MSLDMSSETSLLNTASDAETSVYDPITETTIFRADFSRDFAPNLDPAFAPEAEYVLSACGTPCPGQMQEPCQHSTSMVMCCACAGCMAELWDCGRQTNRESWMTWRLRQVVHNPWVTFAALSAEIIAVVQLVH